VSEAARPPQPVQLGRYAVYGEIASGGMATIHLGMLLGSAGFSRAVAIKKLHPIFAKDPDFAGMFLDEARLAARIRHPNVVSTLDVVATDEQLFLVMEYVQGETLSHLCRIASTRNERIPPEVVSGVMTGALAGLHAAHEAKDERGEALNMVHRDVSPQNIMVGTDGIARVLDFGVAKAAGRSQMTRSGQLKGKLAYMSPEQIGGDLIDRRTDVYAATIVLWEALVGRRLYGGENEGEVFAKVMKGGAELPSRLVPALGTKFDTIVVRGLSKNPEVRFQTARDMALAVARAAPPASAFEVGEWVESLAAEKIAIQAGRIVEIEGGSVPPPRAVSASTGEPSEEPQPSPIPVSFSEPQQPVADAVEGEAAQEPDADDDADTVYRPVAGATHERPAERPTEAAPAPPEPAMATVPLAFTPVPVATNTPVPTRTPVPIAATATAAAAAGDVRTEISAPSSALERLVADARALAVRRKWIVVGAVALIGLVATIVLAVSLLRSPEPVPEATQPEEPSASAASPSPPAPAPSASPAASVAPLAPAASSVAQPASRPVATQAPPSPTTVKAPLIAPGPRVDPCNPPFTIDPRGVKHYKAHCL
jgi:serine/threonine protein kinase